MATLNISEFSCLREATFTLAPVNVIIGPQGSGKSVTTKLLYFFADVLSSFLTSAERGDTLEQYKAQIAKQFCLWFPPPAWGPGRFNIGYAAGQFSARVLRRRSRGRLTEEVAVTFSDWFGEVYHWTSSLYERSRENDDLSIETPGEVTRNIDRIFRVRDAVSQRISKDLGENYIAQQTFIPAGRAFFTSIGRLVAGIEQAGSLDPVTIKFARLFANLRDRGSLRSRTVLGRLGDDFLRKRSAFMNKLFGGEIKFENDAEFVETADGRKIPFSSLSSGQQELLPMWSLMDYFNERDALRVMSARRPQIYPRELIYIEEPEAHLFPSAQSFLMEFLIGSLVSSRNGRSLIITTHSPYIMSKLNVFLKAGQLSRRKKRNQDINEIVPRECWLTDKQLSAVAIENGRLRNLIDEDDLIDGRYLDQVSEEISRDFSRLLKIEANL
ncbi:ATP-binding protein [Mesorhizobium sp.]|uniref:AAA family ATPase n=1 Tax=Mesorhizobium sp. TaxID=1871066 RepID=UPI000FE7A108|nr:ATP-binding protein [Mesorhizobium sp.]RWK34274.1 MAG: ATP-binding protein [Mesorhizobium sp.]RWK66320.1 MAG: ATP-binding protein [Mesorhizobium sp.]RWK72602.1 MAG: ATP-binding protein [Mesorhizobium sp.]RWK80788.1 MAG: ATP-binding protein [Mesorhizobium sp.]RWL08052.1 MAG: ATP-binding protein [Mesorhizobium sp.]